ncbi:MAG: PaaI family thioesterase [Ilumatobacteraceae bacterium]
MTAPVEHTHLDPLVHVAQPDHPDQMADARADAGRAIRDIGHALVGHHAPIEVVQRVAATLDPLSAELASGRRRDRAEVRREGEWGEPPDDGAVMTSYDERPVSGRASPWGLDLTLRRDGDEAVAALTLRAAHEGAPGRCHGGIVAALFDDVYGFVLSILAQSAFTGELSVRYEAGVPIGVPLECRVRLSERSGRKLHMTGELSAAGQVLARSKATFIAIDPSAFGSTSADGTG